MNYSIISLHKLAIIYIGNKDSIVKDQPSSWYDKWFKSIFFYRIKAIPLNSIFPYLADNLEKDLQFYESQYQQTPPYARCRSDY